MAQQSVSVSPQDLQVDKNGLVFSINPLVDTRGLLIQCSVKDLEATLKNPLGQIEKVKLKGITEKSTHLDNVPTSEQTRYSAMLIPSTPGIYEVSA